MHWFVRVASLLMWVFARQRSRERPWRDKLILMTLFWQKMVVLRPVSTARGDIFNYW